MLTKINGIDNGIKQIETTVFRAYYNNIYYEAITTIIDDKNNIFFSLENSNKTLTIIASSISVINENENIIKADYVYTLDHNLLIQTNLACYVAKAEYTKKIIQFMSI